MMFLCNISLDDHLETAGSVTDTKLVNKTKQSLVNKELQKFGFIPKLT